jgi:enoyl-CoA hydratase/carnithine racemase
MSRDEVLIYEVSDGLAWLTLNRPDARNALNAELRAALWDAFRRFAADEDARVAIVRGRGPVFCAGGDLKEMADTSLRVPPPDYMPHLQRTLTLEKPVIAAVQGGAFGGGFLLAQMADLCIAAHDAQFAIAEARWGRGAPWAASLPWLIPPRAALELLLLARPLSATRAYELGLVNRLAAPAELDTLAQEVGATIAANAPLSVAAAKRMVYATAGASLADAFAAADAFFEPAYLSEDAQEGPRAFREGREPHWRGR